MISLKPADAAWIDQNDINASKFMRRAIEVAREVDARDCAEVVQKLRGVNEALQKLCHAYQMDLKTKEERAR